jgi:tRNA (guanine37-N1)-methyltransferase
MRYTVLSLFPEIIDSFFSSSILAKALERGALEYKSVNIRDYALDKHRTCDDAPYGGGAGMLMLAAPLAAALTAVGVQKKVSGTVLESPAACGGYGSSAAAVSGTVPDEKVSGTRVIYMSPAGRLLNQRLAEELSKEKELVIICGRYEGIDQRIIDLYVDDEISIGNYVLSSGESAAIVLIDATYRLLDGVITETSLLEESHGENGLLEYPQYTRPEVFEGLSVPEVLLSGHHENIKKWRTQKSLEKTRTRRAGF